eukprot:gnl/TRDRNA2_/TRDRNA2_162436_c0_seq1.p2 gnl/TRDRNA2_/TRDRNA2_162436_c0~~gnl/TRDRNA2_/TRDRNA2_162436_c0_seq1.p2  ORF type:complete len:102 (-),score=4.45 gnl/TRDRNA2_/TRDRNA2_162436_c0_seq1:46-351(-)
MFCAVNLCTQHATAVAKALESYKSDRADVENAHTVLARPCSSNLRTLARCRIDSLPMDVNSLASHWPTLAKAHKVLEILCALNSTVRHYAVPVKALNRVAF